jgi:hypothetical protein
MSFLGLALLAEMARAERETLVERINNGLEQARGKGRVALVGERPQGRIHLLFDFQECALVHWRYGKDDLPPPMQAMQDTAPSGSAEKMEWMRLAVLKLASMRIHAPGAPTRRSGGLRRRAAEHRPSGTR